MSQEPSGKGVGLSIGILGPEDYGVQQGIQVGQAIPCHLGRWPSREDSEDMGTELQPRLTPSC